MSGDNWEEENPLGWLTLLAVCLGVFVLLSEPVGILKLPLQASFAMLSFIAWYGTFKSSLNNE